MVPGGMEVEISNVFFFFSSQILAAGATVQILLFAMVSMSFCCSNIIADHSLC